MRETIKIFLELCGTTLELPEYVCLGRISPVACEIWKF
jgi:hypothetical protein